MHYQPPPTVYKNPGLAAVLSFFYMGLGQIYNGQIAKGVAFIVAYTISWVMIIVLIGFFTTPILWILGMVDAYRSSEKLNRDMAMGVGRQGPMPGGPATSDPTDGNRS